MVHDVEVNWDNEAGVWCAVCDSIPLALECHPFDRLLERVKVAAHEILEINGGIEKDTQLRFKAVHEECIA